MHVPLRVPAFVPRPVFSVLAASLVGLFVACQAPAPHGGEGAGQQAGQPNGTAEGATEGATPGGAGGAGGNVPGGAAAMGNGTGPAGSTATEGGNAVAGGNVVANPNAAGVNANAPIPNGNDVAITKVASIANPNIGFDDFPVGGSNKFVALTFDDGPDGAQGATTMVLDTLKKEGLPATFFLCANIGFANLETDPIAQAQLKRIVAEGHQVANHTYDHKDLATLTNAQVADEFQRLNDVYNKVLGPTAPVMTMVRTPFGSPFQLDNPNTQRLASTITKFGVQVGWGMDPKDWTFDHYSTNPTVFNADVQSVIKAVQTLIDNKQYGIILLHAVHLPSATALPTVISMFRNAGYKFVSVEDVIRAQYGANSSSIMAANKAAGLAN